MSATHAHAKNNPKCIKSYTCKVSDLTEGTFNSDFGISDSSSLD